LSVVLVGSIQLLLAGEGARPASLYGMPLDDVWIHLSYARSLAQDGTFGWNPGTWENGITAPLWAVLLAVPLKLGVEPALAAKGLSIFSSLVIMSTVWALARELAGAGAAAIACAVLVLEPWTSILAVSGMEVLAAGTVALAAVFCALRSSWLGCGWALAAAGLLRPELGLLVPLVLLCAPSNRERLRVFLPPACAGGAWMLFGLGVAGHPLPNAFRTKVNAGFDPVGQIASVGGLFSAAPRELGMMGGIALFLACALILCGLVQVTRQLGPARGLGLLVLPPFALVLFYVVALPLGASADPLVAASVQSIYFARYLLIVLPWLVILGAVGWIELWRRSPGRAGQAVLLSLGFFVLSVVAVTERSALREAYIRNTEEIEVLHGGMADWIRANLPSDAVVGVSDAGRIRFGVLQKTVDLTGLNSSELIGLEDRVPLLQSHGMTHAAVWPAWHGQLVRDSRLKWTRIGGTRVERNTTAAYPKMLLYRVEVR